MKKLFILLAILATSMSFAQTIPNIQPKGIEKAYSDGKEGVKTMYGDVKSLAPELKSGLAEIAKGLKTASQEAWEIWWRFFRQYKKMTSDLDETEEIKITNIILTVILFVLVVIDSSISATHFADMLTGFLNPRYSAMTTLIELALKFK
jgi:hypothetical protein